MNVYLSYLSISSDCLETLVIKTYILISQLVILDAHACTY